MKEIQARLSSSKATSSPSSHLPLNVEILHLAEFETPLPGSAITRLPGEVYGENHGSKLPYKPSRFDFEALKERLKKYKAVPYADTFQKWNIVRPTVVLVEGLYALYDKDVREMSSMRIFMDLDGDVRLGRWILQEAGEDKEIFTAILNEVSISKLSEQSSLTVELPQQPCALLSFS